MQDHITEAIDRLRSLAHEGVRAYDGNEYSVLDVCKFCRGAEGDHMGGCAGIEIDKVIALLDDCEAECTCA